MKRPLSSLRRRHADAGSPAFRIAARALADGIQGGMHRSSRKGAGIEFAGHRPYTPGDDLRHLDRHALLRHGRLLLREFHSDTERAVHLLVDASTSMTYRGEGSATSKLRHAALLAAAVAFSARKVGDPVGLSIVGVPERDQLPTALPRLGGEAFERVLGRLETLFDRAENSQDATRDDVHSSWLRSLSEAGQRLPRGAVVLVLSDLLDMEDELARELGRLCTHRRRVVAIQILDPTEIAFPFQGAVVLKDSETQAEIETDADSARKAYLERLDALTFRIRSELQSRGGRLTRLSTAEDSVEPLRQVLQAGGRQ